MVSSQALLQRLQVGRIKLDFISLLWFALSVTVGLYASTFIESNLELATKTMFSVILLISGLFLTYVTVGFTWSPILGEIYFWPMLGVSMVGLFFINIAAPVIIPQSISPVSSSLFAVLIAVSEESFFRGFIQSFLEKATMNPLLSILGSALIFLTYHSSRYGTSPQSLLIVFGGGLILAGVMSFTKRLSIVCTAHALYNLLASLGVG